MRRGLISTGLRAEFIHNTADTGRDAPVTVIYDAADPYAVLFDFPGNNPWTIARDILTAGLNEPSGIGDVRVWPWPRDNGLVAVSISSHEGSATFLVPSGAMRRFLTETRKVVPQGRESDHLDCDVDALLPAWVKEFKP